MLITQSATRDGRFPSDQVPSLLCLRFLGQTPSSDEVDSLREVHDLAAALVLRGMFLMANTRCGISAKQLERELGVTYKTAWRMFNKIRNELMNDEGDDQLDGKVEVDETSWGGKPRRKHKTRSEAMQFRENRTTVLGMIGAVGASGYG
jgi:hypothetical protein